MFAVRLDMRTKFALREGSRRGYVRNLAGRFALLGGVRTRLRDAGDGGQWPTLPRIVAIPVGVFAWSPRLSVQISPFRGVPPASG